MVQTQVCSLLKQCSKIIPIFVSLHNSCQNANLGSNEQPSAELELSGSK